jgi:hypothetical protein
MRDRFAMALAGAATAYLAATFFISFGGGGLLDRFVLGVTLLVQAAFVVTWIVVPRLPRWMILGYALILIATGIGFQLTGGVDERLMARAHLSPLALIAAGVVMLIASLFHRSETEGRAIH